jgi:hypothetical protein
MKQLTTGERISLTRDRLSRLRERRLLRPAGRCLPSRMTLLYARPNAESLRTAHAVNRKGPTRTRGHITTRRDLETHW